jgi:hypothetical protein
VTKRFVKDVRGVEAFKAWLNVNNVGALLWSLQAVIGFPYTLLWKEFDVKLADLRKPVRFLGVKRTV